MPVDGRASGTAHVLEVLPASYLRRLLAGVNPGHDGPVIHRTRQRRSTVQSKKSQRAGLSDRCIVAPRFRGSRFGATTVTPADSATFADECTS
jgi:hypothetical protein